MAKELFIAVPGKAQRACTGFLLAGLLWLAFGSVGLYLTIVDGTDGFREYGVAYLFLVGILSLLSLILLMMGKPAGRITAWLVLPLLFIFMPVGTAIGIYIVTGLHCHDMQCHLDK